MLASDEICNPTVTIQLRGFGQYMHRSFAVTEELRKVGLCSLPFINAAQIFLKVMKKCLESVKIMVLIRQCIFKQDTLFDWEGEWLFFLAWTWKKEGLCCQFFRYYDTRSCDISHHLKAQLHLDERLKYVICSHVKNYAPMK